MLYTVINQTASILRVRLGEAQAEILPTQSAVMEGDEAALITAEPTEKRCISVTEKSMRMRGMRSPDLIGNRLCRGTLSLRLRVEGREGCTVRIKANRRTMKGFSHMQFDLICLTEAVTRGTVIARENYLHHKEDRDEILNKYSPVILLDLLILGVIIAVGIYFGFLTYLQKSLFFGAFTLVLLLFLLHTTVQMSRWALFARGLKRFGIVDPEDLN